MKISHKQLQEMIDKLLNERIVKRGSKWAVVSKDGSKTLGTHDTKEDAVKQLQAIEINKHK